MLSASCRLPASTGGPPSSRAPARAPSRLSSCARARASKTPRQARGAPPGGSVPARGRQGERAQPATLRLSRPLSFRHARMTRVKLPPVTCEGHELASATSVQVSRLSWAHWSPVTSNITTPYRGVAISGRCNIAAEEAGADLCGGVSSVARSEVPTGRP